MAAMPRWVKGLAYWGSLMAAIVALLSSYFLPGLFGKDDNEMRRWKTSTTSEPTPVFTALVKPPLDPDRIAESKPIPRAAADWTKSHVSVYSVPTLTPPHPRPTLRDLADSGQAHAIDFLARDSTSHAWAELQQALIDASEPTGGRDPFRFDRVLVATVTKGSDWDPGDRMDWTKVFIEPINFEFAGYTVAATENVTVKVTSVEATTTRKVSAEVGLSIPGVEGPKASFGPSNEHTFKTTADVNAQYERLGIDIRPSFLRIIRESETGGNALGNTTIALSVLTDPNLIWKKYPDDETHQDPDPKRVLLVTNASVLDDHAADLKQDKAILTVLPQAQLPHCALMARVWMLYEQRHIDRGQEFYNEAQHDVSLRRDADFKKDVEMVRADDVSPAVWSVQIVPKSPDGITTSQGRGSLSGRVDDGPWRELVFTDYNLASKVALWMRTHPGSTVSKLNFNNQEGESLYPSKKRDDDCTHGTEPKNSKVVSQSH